MSSATSAAAAGIDAGRQLPPQRSARRLVRDALLDVGLDPDEQAVPGCRGSNVLATIPGSIDRWILVGAHHDRDDA